MRGVVVLLLLAGSALAQEPEIIKLRRIIEDGSPDAEEIEFVTWMLARDGRIGEVAIEALAVIGRDAFDGTLDYLDPRYPERVRRKCVRALARIVETMDTIPFKRELKRALEDDDPEIRRGEPSGFCAISGRRIAPRSSSFATRRRPRFVLS